MRPACSWKVIETFFSTHKKLWLKTYHLYLFIIINDKKEIDALVYTQIGFHTFVTRRTHSCTWFKFHQGFVVAAETPFHCWQQQQRWDFFARLVAKDQWTIIGTNVVLEHWISCFLLIFGILSSPFSSVCRGLHLIILCIIQQDWRRLLLLLLSTTTNCRSNEMIKG